MIPFDASMFPDTVIIYPPVDGTDVDGGPTQTDGAGVTFAAAVQSVDALGRATKRLEPYQGTVAGEVYCNVLVGSDPTSVVTRPDVTIAWTAREGVPFSMPIVLKSQGKPPQAEGHLALWNISAVIRG